VKRKKIKLNGSAGASDWGGDGGVGVGCGGGGGWEVRGAASMA
jgi:hypothetical protein